MTDDDTDPLRPRLRPGVRVDAEAATWESTVFAVSVGGSVRYLEVPADQVADFLAAVDAGTLDDDLVSLATTPTGATLNLPGRVRRLAAFDRLIRGAIARAERDPVTGQLTETGWRPRKRQRDEQDQSQSDQSQSEQSQADQHPDPRAESQSNPAPQQAAQPASASSSTVAPVASSVVAATVVATAASTAAKGGWWSSPMVVAGAAAAVVVVAAGSIFVATRSSGDAATAAPAVATASPADVASATGSGGLPTTASNGSSGSAAEPAASITESVTAAAGTTGAAVSEPAAASAGSAAAGGAVSAGTVLSLPDTAAASAVVPPASGPVNPFAGTYSLTRTVTDNSGNPDVAVGSVDTGTVTLTADCADPGCAVNGGGWGPAAVSGSQLTFAGTSAEPCTNDPGISVIDSWSVTLNADGPVAAGAAVTSLQGVGTVTVSALNGCDATIAPITSSYALTRTG